MMTSAYFTVALNVSGPIFIKISLGLKKKSTMSEGYQDHSLLLFAFLLFLLRVIMSRRAADGRRNQVRAPWLLLIQLGSVWKGERCTCCAQLTRPAPDVNRDSEECLCITQLTS